MLELPNLTLFNRQRTKSHMTYPVSQRPSPEKTLFEVIKHGNTIQNQLYRPYLHNIPVSSIEQEQRQIRNEIELSYMNTYYDSLHNNHLVSFQAKPTHEYDLSFQRYAKETPCWCEQTHTETHNHKPSLHQTRKQTKNVYLGGKKNWKDQIKIQEANKSIVEGIFKSAYIENSKYIKPNNPSQNNNIRHNNESNLHQSLIIDVPPRIQPPKVVDPKVPPTVKNLVSHEVQTEQLPNRSSFVIHKNPNPQKMDHKNFKKTITLLNDKISNMKLDMFGDDIIIDLSDLIETKEQYIEESQSLLNSLNLLADQKLHKVEAHKDKNQKMVWPDL